MTNPGDIIEPIPRTQLSLMTRQFRAMLRVTEAMGLGELTVSELLEQVEQLWVELSEETDPDFPA